METPSTAILSNSSMSTEAKIALATTVVGLSIIGYFVFIYEKDNVTADEKFNRKILFTRVEQKEN